MASTTLYTLELESHFWSQCSRRLRGNLLPSFPGRSSCQRLESRIAQSALPLTTNYSGEAHLWVINTSVLTIQMSSASNKKQQGGRLSANTEEDEFCLMKHRRLALLLLHEEMGRVVCMLHPALVSLAEHVCMAGKRRDCCGRSWITALKGSCICLTFPLCVNNKKVSFHP